MCWIQLKDKITYFLFLCIMTLALGTFLSGCATFKECSASRSGYNALTNGDFRTALTQCQEALWMCEEDNYKQGVVLNLINMGCAYQGLGEYSEALDSYKKGLDLTYEINYKKLIPYGIINMALVSACIGDFDTATYYLHKLNINDLPKDLKGYFWALKGEIYLYSEARYKLGLDCEMKALELGKLKTNFEKVAKAGRLEEIALAFLKKGDYKDAYQYATDSSKSCDVGDVVTL